MMHTLGKLLTAIIILFSAPAAAETFYVEGHGSVPLAVTVTGPEDSPEILFLHGIGMGAEAFSPQMESDLAEHFRMVAFDLRGHGMSGKPWAEEAYTDRAAWAGDVARVIAATGLKRPVIIAWSYGTMVAADYLMTVSPDSISGLVLISALGGLVQQMPPDTPPDPELLEQLQKSRELRMSPLVSDQKQGAAILAPMLYEITPDGPSKEWQELAGDLGILVPAYAQGPLRKHPMDNGSLVPRLAHVPILAINGAKDLAVSENDLKAFRAALPHAQTCTFAIAGHSLFAEQPERFNRLVESFVKTHWSLEQ